MLVARHDDDYYPPTLLGIIFPMILIVHSKRDEPFYKVHFFCITYWLGLPGMLLMYSSVSFLIIPSVPTITGTEVVLRCHIFSFFYFQVFVLPYFIIFFD